jgi:hypothetical protein
VSEIPDGCGLKYCTQNRALTVKKAQHRDVRPPMELFCYILMCRATVRDPGYFAPPSADDKLQKYRQWLADEKDGKALGHEVAYRMACKMDAVQRENDALKKRIDVVERTEKVLASMGIDHRAWYTPSEEEIRQAADRFRSGLPVGFLDGVSQMAQQCATILDSIKVTKGS